MQELHSFDYTFLRIVPRIEIGEFINIGVILFCRPLNFLDARFSLDSDKLRIMEPAIDSDLIKKYLDSIQRICDGSSDAGYFSTLSQADRFHWLTGIKSTIIQPSATHCGLTDNPDKSLNQIFSLHF